MIPYLRSVVETALDLAKQILDFLKVIALGK